MINGQIRDKEVRVIAENGDQLGVMPVKEAMKLAQEAELDLVKIAPKAQPPVCKIIDYGKYRYELARKEKEAKKKQKTVEVKEVRISPNIDTNDLNTKVNKAKKFIAYFQNYTNTFLPVDKFEKYLVEAAQTEDIVGISVSTRPDCITKEYLDCLKKISEEYQVKISMEYGLQTVNYKTLNKIDRGHTLAEYLDAVLMTAPYGFEICTHIILNLPGDDMTDVIETAKILSALPVQIVKLHSLYIPKGSKMYEEYKEGKITLCDPEEYLDRLVNFICYVRKDMVIERLFSRVPKEDASFSNWGISWWKLKDRFDEIMETNDYMQGCKFDYLNGAALRRWEI